MKIIAFNARDFVQARKQFQASKKNLCSFLNLQDFFYSTSTTKTTTKTMFLLFAQGKLYKHIKVTHMKFSIFYQLLLQCEKSIRRY